MLGGVYLQLVSNKNGNKILFKFRMNKNIKIILILTVNLGPCGGKTTGQTRLCTFFENLGWKVILSDSISQKKSN